MEARRREVSESAFEYLLAEILHSDVFAAPEEQMEDGTEPTHKLELLGYDVGYRQAVARGLDIRRTFLSII
jgi:hypothetical protein